MRGWMDEEMGRTTSLGPLSQPGRVIVLGHAQSTKHDGACVYMHVHTYT